MKKYYILLSLSFFSLTTYAQFAVDKTDNNSDWKKHATFIEQTYNGPIVSHTIQYNLIDGYINSYQILQNTEIEAEVDVKYDRGHTVGLETKIYDSGKGTIREVMYKNDFRYDEKNNLIDDGTFLYSKFLNGRPQIATSKDYNEIKKQGVKKILTYDDSGLLKLTKATEESPSMRTVTVTTYKYDKCNNISEISNRISNQEINTGKKRRKESTTVNKPTIVKESFEYEYNGCLWTKKYQITNDQKQLISERSFD